MCLESRFGSMEEIHRYIPEEVVEELSEPVLQENG